MKVATTPCLLSDAYYHLEYFHESLENFTQYHYNVKHLHYSTTHFSLVLVVSLSHTNAHQFAFITQHNMTAETAYIHANKNYL